MGGHCALCLGFQPPHQSQRSLSKEISMTPPNCFPPHDVNGCRLERTSSCQPVTVLDKCSLSFLTIDLLLAKKRTSPLLKKKKKFLLDKLGTLSLSRQGSGEETWDGRTLNRFSLLTQVSEKRPMGMLASCLPGLLTALTSHSFLPLSFFSFILYFKGSFAWHRAQS